MRDVILEMDDQKIYEVEFIKEMEVIMNSKVNSLLLLVGHLLRRFLSGDFIHQSKLIS